jgi:hypothetical protein
MVVRTAPSRSPRTLWHRPRLLFAVQVVAVLSVGVAVAAAVGASATTTLAVVLVSVLTRFHVGRAAIRPGFPRPGRMASDIAVPFAIVGATVAYSGAAAANLRDAAALIVSITAVDVLGTVLRRRTQRPVRVIIVGDPSAIVRSTRRWRDDGGGEGRPGPAARR